MKLREFINLTLKYVTDVNENLRIGFSIWVSAFFQKCGFFSLRFYEPIEVVDLSIAKQKFCKSVYILQYINKYLNITLGNTVLMEHEEKFNQSPILILLSQERLE